MATQKRFEEEHGEGLCLLKTNITTSADCEQEEHADSTVIAPPSSSKLHKQLATKIITTCMSVEDKLLWLKANFQEHASYYFGVLLSNTTACPGHEDLMGQKFFLTKEDVVKPCSLFSTDRSLKDLLPWAVTAVRISGQAELMKSFRGWPTLLSESVASPGHDDITELQISFKNEQEGLVVTAACSLFVIDWSLTYLLPGSTAAARSKDQLVLKKSFEEEHGEGLCLFKARDITEHQMGRKKSSAEEHVDSIVIAPPSSFILAKQLATETISTCTSAKDNLLWLKEKFQEHVNYFFNVLLSNTTACPGHEDLMGQKVFFTEEDIEKASSIFLTDRNLKNLLYWTVTSAKIEVQAELMKSFRGFEERSAQSLLSELFSETAASPGHEDITGLEISLKEEQEGFIVKACSLFVTDRRLTHLLPGSAASKSIYEVVLKKSFGECEEGLIVKACSLFFIDRNRTYLSPVSTAAARSKDQVGLKKSFGECEEGIIQLKQSILPDEVIVFEILTRVPLGALIHQFQWVCREWQNHFHESKFQLIHSQRTPIVASGFFLVMERFIENISDSIRFFPFNDDPSSPPRNPSPSLDFLPSPVEIVGSSPYGSLLCCVKLQTRKSIPVFYICKPATREWKQIPNPRTRFRNLGMRIVVTQTYPTLQYKIVRISRLGDTCDEHHCEIFDSVTWKWKRSADVKTFVSLADTYGGGVLINGCLHWINYLRQIYAFSIEQEKWNVIQLPPDIVESKLVHQYLSILIDGKIGVLISNKEWTELWVLENYNSHDSWTRRYRKDLRALYCEAGDVCVPLAMSSTGIIFMLCVCPSSRCVVLYKTNDDTYTISAPFPSDVGSVLAFPFDSRFCYI